VITPGTASKITSSGWSSGSLALDNELGQQPGQVYRKNESKRNLVSGPSTEPQSMLEMQQRHLAAKIKAADVFSSSKEGALPELAVIVPQLALSF
jgi:hypothetical protein